jgi:hypothetical protein
MAKCNKIKVRIQQRRFIDQRFHRNLLHPGFEPSHAENGVKKSSIAMSDLAGKERMSE